MPRAWATNNFATGSFDILLQDSSHKKLDPRHEASKNESHRNADLLWACGANKIREIQNLIAKGVDLSAADYDGRTGLHVAASEGHLEVVKLLIKEGIPLSPVDRWGGTPLDDAKREHRTDVVELLKSHLAKSK